MPNGSGSGYSARSAGWTPTLRRTSRSGGCFVEARIRYGDDRFWPTDAALADAAQEHKTLSRRQAREVMRHASREWISSRIGRDRVQAVQALLTGGGQD
jgi:hypothetical protein